MSQVSGSASHVLDSAGTLVSGPCHLLGISINVWSDNSTVDGDKVGVRETNYLIAKTKVSLRDGSATGDELFSYHIPAGVANWSCGQTPFTFMFGNGYIRYNSGIYVLAWDGTGLSQPAPAKSQVTVYYEGA
jgi:hypothetical protein